MRETRSPRSRASSGPITPGRVLKWIALGVARLAPAFGWSSSWSAPSSRTASPPEAERALSGGGSLLTGSNILVLGSDTRAGDSIDESQSGPARADTIMLLHAGARQRSQALDPARHRGRDPRPRHQKINAAYALGGPALMIETVEGFIGND